MFFYSSSLRFLCLFYSVLVISSAVAQADGIHSRNLPFSCNGTLQQSQTPGLYNVVYDSDENFVYSPSNCTSTNQKIIPRGFPLVDCSAAIEAICGSTSKVSGTAGSWTWAWHTTQGTTCQAGFYQAIDANTNGVGLVDTGCCLDNFRAMHGLIVNPQGRVTLDPYAGNRLSVNIAPGGFPYTKAQYSMSGNLVNADGAQIAAGHPSYILQAYDESRREADSDDCMLTCGFV